jgi:hypothetical protein
MNDSLFKTWMDRAGASPGIFACGVLLSDNTHRFQSHDPGFPESKVAELLQCMNELAVTLHNNGLDNSRLCWAFQHGEIHFLRCPDGTTAFLITPKDFGATPLVEELFAEFPTANSATAGQRPSPAAAR